MMPAVKIRYIFGSVGILVMLLLCAFYICDTSAIEIDSQIQQFLEELIAEYNNSEPRRWKFRPDVTATCIGKVPGDHRFFLPEVIVWCPITTYSIVLKCPKHGCDLSARDWLFSSKPSRQPRLLYGMNGNCLLIGRVYHCNAPYEIHRILSTDIDILRDLPLFVDIPYVLTHRSGCTKDLMTFICAQISLGNNFNQITRVIEEIQHNNFIDKSVTYCSLLKQESSEINIESVQRTLRQFESSWVFTSPSADLLISLFLEYFEARKAGYEAEMTKIMAKSISMDHTFKISKNIGIDRPIDNKWLRQYDCLFLVMNELGEIVTWVFTKGTAFSESEAFLERFRDRLVTADKNIECAMVDNCCQWRQKLQSVFGPGLAVKLDLFHAVQRFTQALPKTGSLNTLRHICISDFSKIFRQDNDMGSRREMRTPSPSLIIRNLDNFLKKWTAGQGGLVNENCRKVINNLRIHIERECLSGIPPGHGTERNENLHRSMNRSLISGATRIGPELAFALLTVLFYYHNCRMNQTKKKGGWLYPNYASIIESVLSNDRLYSCSRIKPQECFGFARNSSEKDTELRGWLRNNFASNRIETSDVLLSSCPVDETNVSEILNDELSGYVVHQFYDHIEIRQTFKEQCVSKDHTQFDVMIEFSRDNSVFKSLLHGRGVSHDSEVAEHRERLTRNLTSLKLEVEQVPPDGDCLFHSVCLQLWKEIHNHDSSNIKQHLDKISPEFHMHLRGEILSRQASDCLRQLFVAFLTENIQKYSSFLNMSTEQALLRIQDFKSQGVFSGVVGDIVTMVLADLLRCPIIVVCSMEAVPIIPFVPEAPVHHYPLYIAFNQAGVGHYDSTKHIIPQIIPSTIASEEQHKHSDQRPVSCNCGKDKIKTNPEYKSCTNNDDKKYKTRCPCFKSEIVCSADRCRCVNCCNGKSEYSVVKFTTSAGKRKRKACTTHKKKSGLTFLIDENEEVQQGSWTQYECCLLEAVLRTLDIFKGLEANAQTVYALYDFVCCSRIAAECKLPVRRKSLSQVRGKLEYRKEKYIAFNKFLEQQLKIEMSLMNK